MTEAPVTDKSLSPKWKNLGVRAGSAAILSLICLAPFYFGGWAWAVLVALFGGRMLYEWVRMADVRAGWLAYSLPVVGLVIGIIYMVQGLIWPATFVLFATAALVGINIFRRTTDGMSRSPIGWAVAGALYIIGPSLIIVGLRGNEVGFATTGFTQLIFIILCVVAADVGAYFGGSYFKGPKLAPKLSPNKTWSGFVSGQIFAILIGIIVGSIIGLPLIASAGFALFVALLSVVGDLIESAMKRKLDVKDTGDLLPGHGGLLDRMDSLMMAVTGWALLLLILRPFWPI